MKLNDLPKIDAALAPQAISTDVLLEKYAKGTESSVEDIHARVSIALAAVEQPADQLQRNVLERQRGAVEQLLHEVTVVQLHQRHHGGVGERGVGLVAQPLHGRCRQVVADEQLDDLGGALGVGAVGFARWQRGPLGGNVQAAVGGEAAELSQAPSSAFQGRPCLQQSRARQ